MKDFDDKKIIDDITTDLMQKMGVNSEMMNPALRHTLSLKLTLDEMMKVVEFCITNNIAVRTFGVRGT